ncbi:MAG: hypothetical protein ABIR96_12495, partial [Bdellovibrionota bacterium]
MKKVMLLATTLLCSASVFAGTDMFHGEVTCNGQTESRTVNITVKVSETVNGATFNYVDLTKPNEPWSFDANPKEIQLAAIGYQRMAFEFGHHNTYLKVLGDGDFFGRDTETEQGSYKGKLMLQTGSGEEMK